MTKKKTPEPEDKSRSYSVTEPTDKSRDAVIAELATGGVLNNAGLVTEFSKGVFGDISLTDCAESLKGKAKAVHDGDLKSLETMLVSQAVALNTLFSSLAMRAKMNMGEYMNAAEKYMRLALKAQGQCRATLETLAAIKNPQPYIQNNRAQYQQVNNGLTPEEGSNQTSTHAPARAEKNSKNTNGLLEDKTHEQEWLDTGAPKTAGGNDKKLETVGTKHRPENPGGEGSL